MNIERLYCGRDYDVIAEISPPAKKDSISLVHYRCELKLGEYAYGLPPRGLINQTDATMRLGIDLPAA